MTTQNDCLAAMRRATACMLDEAIRADSWRQGEIVFKAPAAWQKVPRYRRENYRSGLSFPKVGFLERACEEFPPARQVLCPRRWKKLAPSPYAREDESNFDSFLPAHIRHGNTEASIEWLAGLDLTSTDITMDLACAYVWALRFTRSAKRKMGALTPSIGLQLARALLLLSADRFLSPAAEQLWHMCGSSIGTGLKAPGGVIRFSGSGWNFINDLLAGTTRSMDALNLSQKMTVVVNPQFLRDLYRDLIFDMTSKDEDRIEFVVSRMPALMRRATGEDVPVRLVSQVGIFIPSAYARQ